MDKIFLVYPTNVFRIVDNAIKIFSSDKFILAVVKLPIIIMSHFK